MRPCTSAAALGPVSNVEVPAALRLCAHACAQCRSWSCWYIAGVHCVSKACCASRRFCTFERGPHARLVHRQLCTSVPRVACVGNSCKSTSMRDNPFTTGTKRVSSCLCAVASCRQAARAWLCRGAHQCKAQARALRSYSERVQTAYTAVNASQRSQNVRTLLLSSVERSLRCEVGQACNCSCTVWQDVQSVLPPPNTPAFMQTGHAAPTLLDRLSTPS